MKKMFIESLPTRLYKGRICIDWNKSIGLDVKFICENIEGFIQIISYNRKTCYLEIKYNNEIFRIASQHFIKCKLSNLLGLKTTKYKYKIGEIINGLEILDQVRCGKKKYKTKGYKYKCIKDEYLGEITESSLINNCGCPVCSNNLVIKGINDIETTNPEIIKYFVDKNESNLYSIGTKQRIKVKCPLCGLETTRQPINLVNYNFKCPRCSDGVSYPEKFMFSLLEQLQIDFITQKMFKWSKRRAYDFYISDNRMIIETHGLQHYEENCGNWNSLDQEIKNDNVKRELAIQNNIKKYIVIDCRISDLEWIKNNIINSELSEVYNLSNIDWIKCHQSGCSSKIKEVCNLWNNGINSSLKISKIMKMSQITILNYIEKGLILKWFN